MSATEENRHTEEQNESGVIRKEITVDTLNDDCLIEIFSYLPIRDRLHIESVCRRWQVLINMAWSNFKHLHLGLVECSLEESMHKRKINESDIKKILSRSGRFLISMTVHSIELDCIYVSPSIAQHCQNLAFLDLFLNTYDENDLAHLFLYTRKLVYLKLGKLDWTFTGDCLANLSTDHIQIMNLSVMGSTQFSRLGAESIKKMYRLRQLVLRNFRLGTDELRHITANDTISILSLTSCELRCGDRILNMNGLKSLYLYATALKLSHPSLRFLRTHVPNTHYLKLCRD